MSAMNYKVGSVSDSSDFKTVIRPRGRTKALAPYTELNMCTKCLQRDLIVLLFKTEEIALA